MYTYRQVFVQYKYNANDNIMLTTIQSSFEGSFTLYNQIKFVIKNHVVCTNGSFVKYRCYLIFLFSC